MGKYKLLLILIFAATTSMAQGGHPGFPGDDPDVPLDGGLSLLVAAAAIYGIKKIRER